MANDIDIDTTEYNRRMDVLDAETRQMEREAQQREVMAMMERIEPPKTFHMNIAAPTNFLVDEYNLAELQTVALGDATPLFEKLRNYGLRIGYAYPMKNPKVVGIIIGGDWSEVSVEWELE